MFYGFGSQVFEMDHWDAIWVCGFRFFGFLQCLDHLSCDEFGVICKGSVLDVLGDGTVDL